MFIDRVDAVRHGEHGWRRAADAGRGADAGEPVGRRRALGRAFAHQPRLRDKRPSTGTRATASPRGLSSRRRRTGKDVEILQRSKTRHRRGVTIRLSSATGAARRTSTSAARASSRRSSATHRGRTATTMRERSCRKSFDLVLGARST